MDSTKNESSRIAKTPFPKQAYIICGWPLILVVIGGAIGGGLGACAYGINMKLYKSSLSVTVKIALNIFTGVAAFGFWIIITRIIHNLIT
jgi:hypothetical protein